MRKISIIKEFETIQDRQFPVFEKREGFVNEARLSATDLVSMAGYPPDANVCVEFCRTDETYLDADFEEDQKQAELCGNDDYGFIDSDLRTVPPSYPVPNPGESWVFVLGCPLHIQ